MNGIWKKWIVTTGKVRVILALLYLFSTFVIPRKHTCRLADKNIHRPHSEYSNRLLHCDSNIEVHHTTTFNRNSFSGKTDSHNLYCLACRYSLSFKTFKPYLNTSLCSTEIVVRTYVLPQLSFTKQIEWFCSTPPRAPPNIAS